MNSSGSSSSRLFGALKNLLDFDIRLIHRFGGRKVAAVCLRKKNAKSVFNLVPVRRAWPGSRAFQRTQLGRVCRILCDQFRVVKERLARGRVTAQSRSLHLLGAGGPKQEVHCRFSVSRIPWNGDEPVSNFSLTRLLRTRQRCELHFSDHLRLLWIVERTDPCRPVNRHRGCSLQQVCADFISIETRITRRRVLAQLEHELKRCNTFCAVDRRFSISVKHLATEGPKDRHEVRDRGITLSRPHDVAINSGSVRTGSLFLVDCFSGGESVVPGRRCF